MAPVIRISSDVDDNTVLTEVEAAISECGDTANNELKREFVNSWQLSQII